MAVHKQEETTPESTGVEKSIKRLSKEKKVLESQIVREICEFLEHGNFFFWRSNNVPVFSHGNGDNKGTMRFRALPKYTPRGIPDIMVLVKGKFVGVEVKRPGAKLRPEQAEFGAKLVMNDGDYYVVHSLDELAALKVFGSWKTV